MSETEIVWADVYEQGRLAFGGQTPGRNLEAQIIEAFEQHPLEVVAAIEKLSERYTAGKVHSPWPLVVKELETASARHLHVADSGPDRERRIRLAETYVRNAGLYEPTVDSILDSVFEDRSQRSLEAWSEDPALRQRISDLWEREQPRARRAEAESEARAAKYLAQKAAKADDEPELEDEP